MNRPAASALPIYGAVAGAVVGFVWAWLGFLALLLIGFLAAVGYVVTAVATGELNLGSRSPGSRT